MFNLIRDDLIPTALPRRRRRGDGISHLGGSGRCVGDVDRRRGSGKIAGEVVLAGDAPSVGDDQLLLLRGRAPTPATSWRGVCARAEGKKGRMSTVIMGMRVRAREVRGKQQHGTAVSVPTSGCRARARAAASSRQRLRPPGGARERVVSERDSGAVWRCEVRARV